MSTTPDRLRHVPGPKAGDRRRAALLDALEELLETHALAEIGVADITRAAGVTRSGFYFYFPSKAAAVAALLADFYEEMLGAAAEWYEGGSAPPRDRLRTGMEASVAHWRERDALMVAMLDAVGTGTEVREIWHEWIDGFVGRVAGRIEEDRAAGLARDSVDAHALATALVGAVFHAMERDVRAIRAGEPPSDLVAPALTDVWQRAIYRS
jgi:AcrR family transcriptional regulator